MADKAITELVSAEDIGATDLFVLQQNNTAKKLPGQVLLNWLTRAADGHGGIQSWVPLKTDGLVKTFRVTFADQTYIDIDVVDGRGVEDVQKVKTEGLVDTYQIIYNDGPPSTFTVTNGAKGDPGNDANVWIRYASQKPTADSHSFGEIPDAWVGIAPGHLSTAPTDWQQYSWYQWKGEKGEKGEPAVLVGSNVEYQASDSGTIVPSGVWSASIPIVPQGRYLWTKTTKTFNSGSPVVSYSVSRMGLDGSGSVSSVADISPDGNGNVPLTAANVGALASTGGDLTGALRMNGQTISGLNVPTANDQAANMGFVNQQVKKAAPYNYAHNSDFTKWIAQPGLCKSHAGSVAIYAGDRWILDSGTVSGSKRADGNGYQNIKLNGTIKQKVANAPDAGKVAIEMISGTADISYSNGVITITSSGGVIKNVLLCTAEILPEYQPKRYAEELAECQRYYQRVGQLLSTGAAATGFMFTATSARFVISISPMRKINPTVTLVSSASQPSVISNGNVLAKGALTFTTNAYEDAQHLCVVVTVSGGTQYANAVLVSDKDCYFEISADL